MPKPQHIAFPKVLLLVVLFVGWGKAGYAQGHAEKTRDPGLLFQQNSQVVRLNDGSLVIYGLQTRNAGQYVAVKSSNDNGHSWGTQRNVFDFSSSLKFDGMLSLVSDRGDVHFFFFNESGIWHSEPIANGWKEPRQIFFGHPGVLRSAVQLPSGRLLLPFYFAVNRNWWNGSEKGFDRYTYMGNYVVSTLYSDDAGDSWKQSSEVIKIPTPSLNQNGAVDPLVLVKKDGTIWMLIANQRGHIYESSSQDGVSWSEPHPSRFISSEAAASITRLIDGSVVLVWNSCLRYPYLHGGTHVLHAAISNDDGRTWLGYREIYRDPFRNDPEARGADYGTGYPTAVATNDDKLLINTGQGKSRTSLILDPATLYETRATSDFTQGLSDWSVFGTRGVMEVDSPDRSGKKVLKVQKVDQVWPAVAIWNFPSGRKGQLLVRLRLNHGFQGARISLADHFSVPFDLEAELHALFELSIDSEGRITGTHESLAQGRWYDIKMSWDLDQYQCIVTSGNKMLATLPLLNISDSGPNYLRLHASSQSSSDEGFLIESVNASLIPSSLKVSTAGKTTN